MAAFRPLEPQWHSDPFSRHEYRFWDGTAWTERVADNGVEGIDPVPPTAAPQPTFRQPEPSAPVVDPTPPPLPPEPASEAPLTQNPIAANPAGANPVAGAPVSQNPAKAAGPFNFNEAELDYDAPEAVGLDRLDGGNKKSGLLAGVGVLLVALLIGGFFFLRGDDDIDPVAEAPNGTTAQADGVEDPSATGFPSVAEQKAIDRLPGGFKCQRAIGDGEVASADGTVDCSANQDPPITILSSSFVDRASSDAYVDQLVAGSGAEYLPESECLETSTGLWTGGDFSGRVVCFNGDSGPTLAWTVGAEPVVNVATSDDSATLVDWWQTSAVPGPVRILQPFPTPREQTALDLIPADLAASCSRFIGKPTDGSVASLECRPGSIEDASSEDRADVDVVYLDIFEEGYDVDAFFNAFELPRADKGGCRTGVPGNNSYSVGDDSVGRVACYVRDGRTWMHWYDSRTQLVGQANFTDSDVVEPYEWWTVDAVAGGVEDRTFDRAERRALQSVPDAIADSCVAEPVNAENDRWAAKLQCQPGSDGLLSVTYFAFQTSRKINNEFSARRGEIASDTGTCTAGGVPAEAQWDSGQRTGRQLCQIRQGVAEIFSADFDEKVAVLIAGENDDIDRLAAWADQNR